MTYSSLAEHSDYRASTGRSLGANQLEHFLVAAEGRASGTCAVVAVAPYEIIVFKDGGMKWRSVVANTTQYTAVKWE